VPCCYIKLKPLCIGQIRREHLKQLAFGTHDNFGAKPLQHGQSRDNHGSSPQLLDGSPGQDDATIGLQGRWHEPGRKRAVLPDAEGTKRVVSRLESLPAPPAARRRGVRAGPFPTPCGRRLRRRMNVEEHGASTGARSDLPAPPGQDSFREDDFPIPVWTVRNRKARSNTQHQSQTSKRLTGNG
jgi:hypothetical protein